MSKSDRISFFVGQIIASFGMPHLAIYAVHQLFAVDMSTKYWPVLAAIYVLYHTFNPWKTWSQHVQDEEA